MPLFVVGPCGWASLFFPLSQAGYVSHGASHNDESNGFHLKIIVIVHYLHDD